MNQKVIIGSLKMGDKIEHGGVLFAVSRIDEFNGIVACRIVNETAVVYIPSNTFVSLAPGRYPVSPWGLLLIGFAASSLVHIVINLITR